MPDYIATYQFLAASYILHSQFQHSLVRHDGEPVQTLKNINPPDHPFSLDLCRQIAKLPPAFEELCFREHLAESVIELLVQIKVWRDAVQTDNDNRKFGLSQSMLNANHKNATACFVLIQNPHLPARDQLIVIALQAYCTLLDDGDCGWSRMGQMQGHTGLFNEYLRFDRATRDAEWLTWVAMLLLASSHTDALT